MPAASQRFSAPDLCYFAKANEKICEVFIMSQALCFNDVSFDVVPQKSQPWVRGSQIATALQYSSAQRVIELYARHADEFTEAMTAVVTLPTEGGPQETRIFSLRGCHLIAMFARTPVAKAFRRWVLDVLDKLAAEERTRLAGDVNPLSLSPAQQAQLHAIVAAKVGMLPKDAQRKAYAEIWSRFGRHFQIAKYQQLPPARIGEAVEYLVGVELKAAQKALPPAQQSPYVDRLQLTPWDKVQLGKQAVAILERGDKVGPRTMECILLKLRYLDAIQDVLKLGSDLAADINKTRVGVFGKIVQKGNTTGCMTDPIMDILYYDTYNLQRMAREFEMTAFSALNASICGARMLGM